MVTTGSGNAHGQSETVLKIWFASHCPVLFCGFSFSPFPHRGKLRSPHLFQGAFGEFAQPTGSPAAIGLNGRAAAGKGQTAASSSYVSAGWLLSCPLPVNLGALPSKIKRCKCFRGLSHRPKSLLALRGQPTPGCTASSLPRDPHALPAVTLPWPPVWSSGHSPGLSAGPHPPPLPTVFRSVFKLTIALEGRAPSPGGTQHSGQPRQGEVGELFSSAVC